MSTDLCGKASVVYDVWRTPPDAPEPKFMNGKHRGEHYTRCDQPRGHAEPWRHTGTIDGVKVTWFDSDYTRQWVEGEFKNGRTRIPYYQLIDGEIGRVVKPSRV